jgi:hypothetical protein
MKGSTVASIIWKVEFVPGIIAPKPSRHIVGKDPAEIGAGVIARRNRVSTFKREGPWHGFPNSVVLLRRAWGGSTSTEYRVGYDFELFVKPKKSNVVKCPVHNVFPIIESDTKMSGYFGKRVWEIYCPKCKRQYPNLPLSAIHARRVDAGIKWNKMCGERKEDAVKNNSKA